MSDERTPSRAATSRNVLARVRDVDPSWDSPERIARRAHLRATLDHMNAADDVGELTADEQRAILEYEVHRTFGLPVEEFKRRWLAGEYTNNDDPRVAHIAMFLPEAW